MIKELILSLILSASSSLPFLDSPKREFSSLTSCYGTYTAVVSNTSADVQYPDNSHLYGNPVYDTTIYVEDNNQHPNWAFRFFYDEFSAHLEVLIAFDNLSLADDALNLGYNPQGNGYYEEDNYTDEFDDLYWACFCYSWDDLDEGYLSFTLVDPSPSYSLTQNLTNCVILSVPTLPQTFTASEVGNQYFIQAAANSGGYGFTSSSLSVTGAQVSNITYSQEQGNTGYYNGLNFTLTLQAANCTISITAYLPTYTLTSELNNCSVSPSLPSTINYGLVQTYTFTANSGYAFNNVVTQWEITGANIGEITYSSLLYGNLYSQVSIELGFTGGNASVKVTAAQYDINSYQEGYDNGYTNGDTAGYNRGYSQGLTAGNSYGVWNWLKQAALTTGEFLSVPLLPGFSIGALLTAIAGLVIIWLFIKGFLFKS